MPWVPIPRPWPVPITIELQVYAKAPLPGQVKTRLIPALGAQGACALHRCLLEHALDAAQQAFPGAVHLYCAPDTGHDFFQRLADRYPISLETQVDGDLGARMNQGIVEGLDRAQGVLVMGSDCPGLGAAWLQRAAQALNGGGRVVMIPAEDGGYVLLGMQVPQPLLFQDMPWGSDRVAAITRQRLRGLGIDCRELPPLWDVDRPEDLARLGDEFSIC